LKALIVYYSRTGTTALLARLISDEVDGDLMEIGDKKNREGLTGVARSIWGAFIERKPKITEIERDISEYDIVFIGTPLWAGNIAGPIRTFIIKYREELGRVAFFNTFGASKSQQIFDNMRELAGKRPEGVLSLRKKEVEGKRGEKAVYDFVEEIKEGLEGFRL